jgi:hypothetical protein
MEESKKFHYLTTLNTERKHKAVVEFVKSAHNKRLQEIYIRKSASQTKAYEEQKERNWNIQKLP